MGRALGANAILAAAFSSGGYGTVPAAGNYRRLPFVSVNLGDEQGLLEDDLIGQGGDPLAPGQDVVNNRGDLVVPVDLRNIGFHLRGLLGAPVSTAGIPASGNIVWSAQPANSSTVTVNGTIITFTTGTPTGNQVKIGATLAETIANLAVFLNRSADANLTPASYRAEPDGVTLSIVHDTQGTGGNAFTLAKGTSPNPNCTLSGATLTGGAASGAHQHLFTSGAMTLPDAAMEIGNPDVPSFGMNRGVMYDTLNIQAQRSGQLNARFGLVAQGEARAAATVIGSPLTDWVIERFSQFSGTVEADGVPLGRVTQAALTYNNSHDVDDSIRSDGRIGGADPTKRVIGLNATVRFDSRALFEKAIARETVAVRFGWNLGANKSLDFLFPRLHLPLVKVPVEGPGGLRASFDMQASKDPTLGHAMRARLINDVSAY